MHDTQASVGVHIRQQLSVQYTARQYLFVCSGLLFVAVCSSEGNAQPPSNIRSEIEKGNSEQAVQLLSQAIEASKDDSTLYYWRGREHFRIGKIDESLADFDYYYEHAPAYRSRQWERGITCYYAGKFQEGSDQFRLYQTFHGNDVENAVWKAMCDARLHGFQTASSQILPIKDDRRAPMMQIYEMFKGNLAPEQVLKVASETSNVTNTHAPRFYAHLYVGLFHEANVNSDLAEQHLQAATKLKIDHYMWDVARVHWERLKAHAESKRTKDEDAKVSSDNADHSEK